MNDLRDTCEPDRATDRAASAARTLAAVAHDAARKYVKRDAVTPQADGRDGYVMVGASATGIHYESAHVHAELDDAERERQNRLRRWQSLPYPNRKGR